MNKKHISITDRNNSHRIAAFTTFAAKILAKHGFKSDETYPNCGTAVRHIHPEKGWAVIVSASYADVSVENDTPDGIPNAHEEPFVKDLTKDGLFEPSICGPLVADFESPLEEVWICIEPHLSEDDIIDVFSGMEKRRARWDREKSANGVM